MRGTDGSATAESTFASLGILHVRTVSLRDIAANLTLVGVELVLLAGLAGAVYLAAMWTIERIGRLTPRARRESIATLQRRLRPFLIALYVLLATVIVAYNGWLISRGADVFSSTVALLRAGGASLGMGLAIGMATLAAATVGVALATRGVHRGLRAIEDALNEWDQLRDNDQSLGVLFRGLDRAIVTVAWMLLAVYAVGLSGLSDGLRAWLVMIVRGYGVIAIGLALIRSSVVIVDTLDGLSHKYAETMGWLRQYDQLRPLVPTFRVCLEYALWVAVASLALMQFGSIGGLAAWGPKLIQAIAIFFVSRVVIELGQFEIGRRLLPAKGLDETTRRRRSTMAPLVRSAFTYAVYFGAAVLILASVGFNPLPFLAGAGILGLVIGFGAQSLINDVVSGFFILFENTYLVGDVVELGKGKGVVEAIEFRTTKFRDDDGRVHVVRNGDVKDVINYSKDYTVAVVPVDIAYGADLRGVFSILLEAGARLRAENTDVLADTQIDGITAFGVSAMTVRTSTRVKPGRQEVAAAALRFWITDGFDRRAASASRKGILPAEWVDGVAKGPSARAV